MAAESTATRGAAPMSETAVGGHDTSREGAPSHQQAATTATSSRHRPPPHNRTTEAEDALAQLRGRMEAIHAHRAEQKNKHTPKFRGQANPASSEHNYLNAFRRKRGRLFRQIASIEEEVKRVYKESKSKEKAHRETAGLRAQIAALRKELADMKPIKPEPRPFRAPQRQGGWKSRSTDAAFAWWRDEMTGGDATEYGAYTIGEFRRQKFRRKYVSNGERKTHSKLYRQIHKTVNASSVRDISVQRLSRMPRFDEHDIAIMSRYGRVTPEKLVKIRTLYLVCCALPYRDSIVYEEFFKRFMSLSGLIMLESLLRIKHLGDTPRTAEINRECNDMHLTLRHMPMGRAIELHLQYNRQGWRLVINGQGQPQRGPHPKPTPKGKGGHRRGGAAPPAQSGGNLVAKSVMEAAVEAVANADAREEAKPEEPRLDVAQIARKKHEESTSGLGHATAMHVLDCARSKSHAAQDLYTRLQFTNAKPDELLGGSTMVVDKSHLPPRIAATLSAVEQLGTYRSDEKGMYLPEAESSCCGFFTSMYETTVTTGAITVSATDKRPSMHADLPADIDVRVEFEMKIEKSSWLATTTRTLKGQISLSLMTNIGKLLATEPLETQRAFIGMAGRSTTSNLPHGSELEANSVLILTILNHKNLLGNWSAATSTYTAMSLCIAALLSTFLILVLCLVFVRPPCGGKHAPSCGGNDLVRKAPTHKDRSQTSSPSSMQSTAASNVSEAKYQPLEIVYTSTAPPFKRVARAYSVVQLSKMPVHAHHSRTWVSRHHLREQESFVKQELQTSYVIVILVSIVISLVLIRRLVMRRIRVGK